MKVIAAGKGWGEVIAALQAGGFANHSTWGANQPSEAPGFIGPTALGYHVMAEGERPEFWVFTDTGVPIHEWKPSAEEFASQDWQIVELDAAILAP